MAKPNKKKDLFKKDKTLVETVTPSFDPPTNEEVDKYKEIHPLSTLATAFEKYSGAALDKIRDRGRLHK